MNSGVVALIPKSGMARLFLAILLATPVFVLAVSLYFQHGMFFWDAKTIPCGLMAVIDTGSPNAYLNKPDYLGACAGYGYEYMLPPAITAILVGLVELVGFELLVGMYCLAYVCSTVAFLYGARKFSGEWLAPSVFFVLIACGVFVFELGGGNITIVFLGSLFALVFYSDRLPHWDALAVVVCVMGAMFKPFFAFYLLIPLFAAQAWLSVSIGSAVVSVIYALDAYLHAPAFEQWLNLSVSVVYGEPHFGVMRVMQEAGLGSGDWWLQGVGFAIWSAVVVSMLWYGRAQFDSNRDRALAALLAVTVIQPRFKEYDAVVIVPLVFWLWSRLDVVLARRFGYAMFGLCFLIPVLWWWARKVTLLSTVAVPNMTQLADPKWLIASQGFLLMIGALLAFVTMCWSDGRQQPIDRQA